jgi:glycosyltransferase involved in cell wall biosynthesis
MDDVSATKKLFYAGMPGDGTGWGVCSANLIRELNKLCDLSFGDADNATLEDHTVFMPLADPDFNPTANVRGWKNLAYCFFEFPLGPKAADNAKRYDVVFCGSTWCLERMRERGITNGKVLVQGVNHDIFKSGPGRAKDGEFWIFSGGKFEYRKGQDLVLAAFKEILKTHPKARLITAWQNAWPATMDSMADSPHIKFELIPDDWRHQLGHLCTINGIPQDRVLTLPGIIPNERMADIYRQCDLGLFPNRCEGGTNLVMMEFMACGKPVVATWCTGHKDVLKRDTCLLTIPWCGEKADGWGKSHPLDFSVAVNEFIGMKKEHQRQIGELSAESMRQWTWERAARTILEEV